MGKSGIGSSIVPMRGGKKRYWPKISAAKKVVPVATSNLPPYSASPSVISQNPAAAVPEPTDAKLKIRKNRKLV